jgi:hypothetical protein
MSFPITIDPAQANKETPIEENFNALLAAGHFGLDLSRRSGLLLWFFGDGDAITDDDVTCTDGATNYVVRALSGGALSVSTGTTNWNDTATYGRIGRAVFAGGTLTWHDHRLKTGGILRGGGAGTGTAFELCIAVGDESTAITAGTAKVTFRMPCGVTLSEVRANLKTAQATNGGGGIFTVDINEGGVSILSTKLTIDNTERTSVTAVTPAVISDATLADDAEMTIDVDQVGDGTAVGLKVTLIGVRA